ncbi:MAG: hypothetical protein K5673_00885 [Lachnospiraceae bacterium]|nr:hypothetical protein [Lachnospiraceae bacterium]
MGTNEFYLMNKNRPLTLILFSEKGEIIDYSHKYQNKDYLPVVSRNDDEWLYGWWKERTIPITRNNIHKLLDAKGVSIPEEYLYKNLALSLNDCYWIKPVDSHLCWEDINLYNNQFKDNTLDWDTNADDRVPSCSPNSSLKGNVEKTWTLNRNKRYLIKGNKFHTSSQSINEVIASEIHRLQGFDTYTEYSLIHIGGKPYDYGCTCEIFTNEHIELITAYDLILSAPKHGNYFEHLLSVCVQNGMDEALVRRHFEYMILTDFVMSQTDRHFNNFGFLRDADTLDFIGSAPIYDSGEAFYANINSPMRLRDLQGLFTNGFETSSERTIKLVSDPYLIDLTKLPPASYLREMYSKDTKDTIQHVDGICYAYEANIDRLRNLQLGKPLNAGIPDSY